LPVGEDGVAQQRPFGDAVFDWEIQFAGIVYRESRSILFAIVTALRFSKQTRARAE
jgi:hypothetical protein